MRRLLALPVVAAPLLLAGCAPAVALTPAPQATSVACAGVMVRLPDAVGALARRTTDAQSTAAWGDPAAVTLRCGVRSPTATTVRCTTFGGVDWLLQPATIDGRSVQVVTTYGRDPGTQLVIDPKAVSAAAVLDAVADPVSAATRQTAECLAISDAGS